MQSIAQFTHCIYLIRVKAKISSYNNINISFKVLKSGVHRHREPCCWAERHGSDMPLAS